MIVLDSREPDIAVTGNLQPLALRTWAAREGLEAICSREGERLVVTSSGSEGCFGGWDVVLGGVQGGRWYRIGLNWLGDGLASVLDGMPIFVLWTDEEDERLDYDYLIVHEPEGCGGRAERVLQAPPKATRAVLRFGLRWTPVGSAAFFGPAADLADAPAPRWARIAVASGKPENSTSVADNVAFFSDLVREAADCKPDLVLMPEVITSWGVPGSTVDNAEPIPGASTEAFAAVARECGTMLAFSMAERDGDLVYNTEVVMARDGSIIGTYRKVHLAILEGWEGVTPGSELPVLDTPLGRVAVTICKDSSILDASRVPAVRGAEIMLLSIMGDHRAVDWRRTPSWWSSDRWRVIMRARAIENHMWVVVARNNSEGSCIVAPSGDILAWNGGGQRVIWADCNLGERLRTWRGSSFADSTWAERRPHLY
ncbi:MAG TPA: carbon-nitrogen hydrolase family protein [Armatimonadota bacterium]|nr:carbon-nitrogen hydrolase family protein [Armatimonadota bacterium]